jgi:hypothetical protein
MRLPKSNHNYLYLCVLFLNDVNFFTLDFEYFYFWLNSLVNRFNHILDYANNIEIIVIDL